MKRITDSNQIKLVIMSPLKLLVLDFTHCHYVQCISKSIGTEQPNPMKLKWYKTWQQYQK